MFRLRRRGSPRFLRQRFRPPAETVRPHDRGDSHRRVRHRRRGAQRRAVPGVPLRREAPTLVDAGFTDTVDVVVDRLDELGVTPERLLLTHGDPDHAGGLAGLAGRYDIETWVPDGTGIDAEPDRRFGDGDEVDRFTAVHVPGHTPRYHAPVDEDAGVAVVGDALFGADPRGLPGGYVVLPSAYFSAERAAEDSVARRVHREAVVSPRRRCFPGPRSRSRRGTPR
ncbi:hypothetical protein BRD03_13625 [Halobacteriales archaeon QS_9_68_17]|nr:MAG: hypothetical protein BRD03_13625 [Halobacteriales archaeon QS_9_68_17]